MFDVAPTEFLLVAFVALVVIGPKELPRVLRTVGNWVGKARRVAQQFRSGFDEMVRKIRNGRHGKEMGGRKCPHHGGKPSRT